MLLATSQATCIFNQSAVKLLRVNKKRTEKGQVDVHPKKGFPIHAVKNSAFFEIGGCFKKRDLITTVLSESLKTR